MPFPPAGRVGVVVVHYGSPEPTRRCLESIVRDTSVSDRQVVVVDNSAGTATGPLDRESLGAAADRVEVEVLAAPDNPGFGAGANRGAARLAERYGFDALVVLNHDVQIAPGYLDAAHRAVTLPRVGAAGGPIRLDRPNRPLWYAGGRFRPLTGTVGQARSVEEAATPRYVTFIPGAAIAVSPEAWREVGGYDPTIFLYHEDLDLCLRLARQGWKLWFEPTLEVIHSLGTTTGSGHRSAFYLEEMAATRLRPHRSRLYRLYLAALHTPYVLLRAASLAGRDQSLTRSSALIRGHRRALAGLWG